MLDLIVLRWGKPGKTTVQTGCVLHPLPQGIYPQTNAFHSNRNVAQEAKILEKTFCCLTGSLHTTDSNPARTVSHRSSKRKKTSLLFKNFPNKFLAIKTTDHPYLKTIPSASFSCTHTELALSFIHEDELGKKINTYKMPVLCWSI